jgi:predicted Zn-dependent protease
MTFTPNPPHPPYPAHPDDRSDLPIVRLLTAAFVTLVGLFTIGLLLGGSAASRPSVSVAGGSTIPTIPTIPRAPTGRHMFLASLGGFSGDTVRTLADFYRHRYGLQIKILDPATIDPSARDDARGQLVAEDLIASMEASYPEVVADHGAVVIGLVSEDLYIRGRPDWAWAFGLRTEARFAIVSTARMRLGIGVSDELAMSRLRKMVTRDIGRMYYRLPVSADPKSVLFGEIDGVADLDRIGEDY